MLLLLLWMLLLLLLQGCCGVSSQGCKCELRQLLPAALRGPAIICSAAVRQGWSVPTVVGRGTATIAVAGATPQQKPTRSQLRTQCRQVLHQSLLLAIAAAAAVPNSLPHHPPRPAPQIIGYKSRPKTKTRRKNGHRQELTRVMVQSIKVGGKAIA